jgi:hypothetical protein
MTRLFGWCLGLASLGALLYFVAFWFYPQEGGDASALNTVGLWLGASLLVGSVLVFFVAGALYVIRGNRFVSPAQRRDRA